MTVEVRQELAAAVNTVDGVTCSPFYSAEVDPGRAWIRLDHVEYPPPIRLGVRFWDVVLVLPQDLAEAEQLLEAKVPFIRAALDPADAPRLLVVDRVSPQQLQVTGVGVLPVVFISGHREE